MSPRNEHLSHSRIDRFETCPLAYRFHYIDEVKPQPSLAQRFGSFIHSVLERLVAEAVDTNHQGPLSRERAQALFTQEWGETELVGVELFDEGLQIIKRFVGDEGLLDGSKILGVEKEFRLPVGPFTLLGYIDRVDRIDDDTIEIIDYKTNRQLFSREELDHSLQLSIYCAAARKLWPWAKNIKLTFSMLRHGVRLRTHRTPEQIESVLGYVEAVGHKMENATDFPPRLNANCGYCEYRARCPAYANALSGDRLVQSENVADLAAVAKEREEVARLVKILYARKDELERVLKAELKDKDELVLGGVRYRMYTAEKLVYPIEPTVETLVHATGKSPDEILKAITTVNNKALDEFVTQISEDKDDAKVAMLMADLQAFAETTNTAKFWAKKVHRGP